MKKIFNFALYDFANSAFTTIIITFIFATYFAKQIAPTPVLGQSYWGWTIGITGFLVAIIGPIVGSFADKKNYFIFFVSERPDDRTNNSYKKTCYTQCPSPIRLS